MLLHATVKGRVQGVGFRYWVVNAAQRLGLAGWVRNTDDGHVELQAEGRADALKEFEQQLWKGPTFSRMAAVEARYTDDKPGHRGFDITY